MYEESSIEDLTRILVKSVIMYKKVPIYVREITEKKELSVFYLGQREKEIIPLSSIDLDFKPVSLGMCNHGGHAYYLSRIPSRQWSQGLTPENINIRFLDNQELSNECQSLIKLNNKSIHSCILGEYPSMEKCITAVEKPGVSEMAFSREFALNKNLSLYYRGDKVGMIDSDNGKTIFENHKKFLKELLNAN